MRPLLPARCRAGGDRRGLLRPSPADVEATAEATLEKRRPPTTALYGLLDVEPLEVGGQNLIPLVNGSDVQLMDRIAAFASNTLDAV
jgi:hypothetical protein